MDSKHLETYHNEQWHCFRKYMCHQNLQKQEPVKQINVLGFDQKVVLYWVNIDNIIATTKTMLKDISLVFQCA